eukprot:c55068_g1_i1 orf=213-371(-)
MFKLTIELLWKGEFLEPNWFAFRKHHVCILLTDLFTSMDYPATSNPWNEGFR